jgi:hypothetical protein
MVQQIRHVRTVVTSTKLREHIRITNFSLRVGVAVLALVFPVLLVSYGYIIEQIPVQKSMSAYYFAFAPEDIPLRVFPMRGVFVGILWAIGCFLILYRGFSKTENWLLNFAGGSAIAVAFFPIEASCTTCVSSRFHYFFAVTFSVLIAFVAWFCNEDTLRELMKEQTRKENELKEELSKVQGGHQRKVELEKKLSDLRDEHKRNQPSHFRLVYRWLGVLMIFAPAAAAGMTRIYDRKIFAVEWAATWVFSAYWLVKSYELSLSRADEKAAMGEMTVREPAANVPTTIRQLSESIRQFASSTVANLRK